MHRFFAYLDKLPRPWIFAAAMMCILFFGVVDYLTGPDLSIFVFYLIPVFFATWFIGRGTGILFSVLSALAWTTATLAGRGYTSSVIPYWNLFMEMVFFLAVANILAGLKKSLEHEKQLARTDHLTGAFNRRYFPEVAEMEINRSWRYGRPFTVAYLDVDNFKQINDGWGHEGGDQLLVVVVQTIRDTIRSSDILSRFGGDEFVILFPEIGSEAAPAVIGKIRQRLTEAMERRNWPVTFSIGTVTFQEPPQGVAQMIRTADKLMYSVKNSGKNSVLFEVFGRGTTSDHLVK